MLTTREIWVAALLWLVVLAGNLGTVTRSPTAWHDEVYFADPAIHFARGDGFRTTAWTLVGEDVHWPGLVPGYGYALGGWLKAVGVGLWQVRALPILLAAVAAGWVWWTSRWRGHVGSSGAGLVLLALLLCGAGVVFSYRSGRGDALAMLWWAAAYAAASTGHRRSGLVGLFALGAVAPWCGMFLCPYVAVMGAILLWLAGRRWLGRVCAAGAGLALGSLCLVAFYKLTGAWDAFVECSRMYQNGILSPHFRFRLDGFRDISLLLVLVGLGIAVFGRESMPRGRGTTGGEDVRRGSALARDAGAGSPASRLLRPIGGVLESAWASLDRRIALTALIAAPVVGVLLALVGKFPTYYSWLVYFPAAVALAHSIPSLSMPRARRLCLVLAGIAIAVGLPARIGVCLLEWDARDHGRVEAFVGQHFHAGDRVACHPSAYFALRRAVAEVYPRATDTIGEIPADARASFTAACVQPAIDAKRLGALFGGTWLRVDELGDAGERPRPGRAEPYRLVAYRRAEGL